MSEQITQAQLTAATDAAWEKGKTWAQERAREAEALERVLVARARKARWTLVGAGFYALAAIWTGVHADAGAKSKLADGPTAALLAAGAWPVYWTALGLSRVHARLFEQAGGLAAPSAKRYFCLDANGKMVGC